MSKGNRPIDRLRRVLEEAGAYPLQVTVFGHDLYLLLKAFDRAELAVFPNDSKDDDYWDRTDLCASIGPLYAEEDHAWGRWTPGWFWPSSDDEYRECGRCGMREYRKRGSE